MSTSSRPPEPWHSLLRELDAAVDQAVRLDCMGGFVVTQLYGLERTTVDLDVFALGPREPAEIVSALGGQGGPLHRKYGIYLDRNAFVAAVPENYESRLAEMYAGCFTNLRLMAFDAYDLALSKLQRNEQKDRDDVRYLANAIPLDTAVLQHRYETEMRWQMAVPEREGLTLKLWIEAIAEERAAEQRSADEHGW